MHSFESGNFQRVVPYFYKSINNSLAINYADARNWNLTVSYLTAMVGPNEYISTVYLNFNCTVCQPRGQAAAVLIPVMQCSYSRKHCGHLVSFPYAILVNYCIII